MSQSLNVMWARPDNRLLLAALAVVQALVIALPGLWGASLVGLGAVLIIGLGFALFSVRRSLLLLLLVWGRSKVRHQEARQ